MPVLVTIEAGNRNDPNSVVEGEFEFPTLSEIRNAFKTGERVAYFGSVEEFYKFAYHHTRVVEQGKIRPKKDGTASKPRRQSVIDQLVNS